MGFAVRKWVERQWLNHAIQIECSTCAIDRNIAPVSIEQTLKPFLVIHTSPLPQKNRPKRNSNCLPEMKECCRDELYISFEEIGWNDWILHPSGYHAYFCRGSCSSAASLTMSATPYNNVIRVGNIFNTSNSICWKKKQFWFFGLINIDKYVIIFCKPFPSYILWILYSCDYNYVSLTIIQHFLISLIY